MKKLLILMTILGLSFHALAYPITPRPLRKLVMESNYIVWAYVSDIGKQKKTKDIWERDVATLVIREVLQGRIKSDTIEVFFTSGMICPAPGIFFKGETVLAFLDKTKKDKGYHVHALSYGVKHELTENDYSIYKQRILEMQQILEMEKEKNCNDLVLDWLVKCAEEKCTRWEGVYELSPDSDFMSYYDREDPFPRKLFISVDQQKKLFNALMKVDTLHYADIALVDISTGINDSILLDFLKLRLTRTDQVYFWPAEDIMKRIVYLTGDQDLDRIQKDFLSMSYDYDENTGKKKELYLQFLDQMKRAKLKSKLVAIGQNNS